MKSDRILSALGAVDEALLEKCDTFIPARHSAVKWTSAAAAIVLAVLACVAALQNKPPKAETDPLTQTAGTTQAMWSAENMPEAGICTGETEVDLPADGQTQIHLPTETVPGTVQGSTAAGLTGGTTTAQTATQKDTAQATASKDGSGSYAAGKSEETAKEAAVSTTVRPLTEEERERQFNKAPIYATKYPTLILDGKHYTSRGRSYPNVQEIAPENPETVTLTGFDGTHKTTGIVYPIVGIARNAAVAVYFPDSEDKEMFAYVNTDYKPSTLGVMMRDLTIPGMLDFHAKGHIGAQEYTQIPASEFDKLFNANAPLDSKNHEADVALFLGGAISGIGYDSSNMFGVTADGYLVVHLLENEYAFYVGRDRTQAFLDFVKGSGAQRTLSETTAPAKKPAQDTTVVMTSAPNVPTTKG